MSKSKVIDFPTVGVANKKTGLPSLHIIGIPRYDKPDGLYNYFLGGQVFRAHQGISLSMGGIQLYSTPDKLISIYFLIKKCKPNKMFLVNMEKGHLEETFIKAEKNTKALYVKKEGKSIVLFMLKIMMMDIRIFFSLLHH